MSPKPRTLTTSSGESDTLTNWATRTGLKKATITRRIREGLSVDEAVNPGVLEKRNSQRLTWGGKTQTIAKWSEETGLKVSTIKRRSSRGCTDGQSLGFEPLPGKLYVDGKRVTLREASQKAGISPEGIRQRLTNGWSPEEAVSLPNLRKNRTCSGPKKLGRKEHLQTTSTGISHTPREWSEITGIPLDTIRQRFYRGVPVDKAVGLQEKPKKEHHRAAREAGPSSPQATASYRKPQEAPDAEDTRPT